MKRAYGWRPDEAPYTFVYGLPSAINAAPPPVAMGMVEFFRTNGEVLDQGPTSACTAHAAAQCLRTSRQLLGDIEAPFPSRHEIYVTSAALSGEPCLDNGRRPRDVVMALAKWGVLSELDDPWVGTSEGACRPLLWDDTTAAAGYRVAGFERLRDLAHIKSALSQQFPVMFGMSVDDAFESLGSGVYNGPTGPALGGHMLTLLGYEDDDFYGVNSWGVEWGFRGQFRISSRGLLTSGVSDIYALHYAPRY